MTRWLIVVVLLGATACARPRPRGPSSDRPPRELAADAQVHFESGDYDLAIAELREAQRQEPSPGVLYNLAQAHRLDGDCVAASKMYGAYRRTGHRGPARKLAAGYLVDLEPCVVAETHARQARTSRRQRRAGLVLGVSGVLLAGAGAAFTSNASAPLLVVGGAAVGVGVTLYVLGRRDEEAPTLTLAPSGDGGRIQLSFGF